MADEEPQQPKASELTVPISKDLAETRSEGNVSTDQDYEMVDNDEQDDDNKALVLRIDGPSRRRPRTYPYLEKLPYPVEEQSERLKNLQTILKNLYLAVAAGDFSPGAAHHTRELRNWMHLKHDLPVDIRVKLISMYYDLALAPGLDTNVADRFASVMMVLLR
jgi:hypothetical protein